MEESFSIIEMEREVTASSEDALTEAYARASNESGRALILSFTRVETMNSGGVGFLVTLLVRANRERKRLLAYGLSEQCRRIFELARLDGSIAVYESQADAIAAVV